RQPAVDQARVDRSHPVVVDAEPRGDGRPEIVDEHVRDLDHSAQDPDAVGVLEVEAHAVLVAVDTEERAALPRERGRVVAQVVALGRLDLDDLGAEIPKERATVGSGDVTAQVEHDDPAEWTLTRPRPERPRRHRWPRSFRWGSQDSVPRPRSQGT